MLEEYDFENNTVRALADFVTFDNRVLVLNSESKIDREQVEHVNNGAFNFGAMPPDAERCGLIDGTE